jgi:hypothetical protein
MDLYRASEQKKASTDGVQFIKQLDNPNPSADPELFHDLGEVQIDTRKKVQTDTRKKASAAAVTLKSSPKM